MLFLFRAVAVFDFAAMHDIQLDDIEAQWIIVILMRARLATVSEVNRPSESRLRLLLEVSPVVLLPEMEWIAVVRLKEAFVANCIMHDAVFAARRTCSSLVAWTRIGHQGVGFRSKNAMHDCVELINKPLQ